ncbi:BTB/POZ domain-containing protein 3-like [Paramacrobiotus metropolitanus]|uniref:BTB/POZ domain-containing protein 3-like n=1 Tax=Paramacrobiotus metropolitanus TaxID=2943436 RepID=UPI002445A381|nr:BTB/POZ domain-containing protein 3-like [Paramacrobiotus metropolitanus]
MPINSAVSSNPVNRGDVGKIAECMREVLGNGEMSDCQFTVGRQYGAERTFPAHRVIMGARSDVFHAMFFGNLPEKCSGPIDIPDIHPDAFANMLSFIYTDTIEILSEDILFQTVNCADKYDLLSLVGLCTRFILDDLNTNSCLEILEKAIHYKFPSPMVMEECLRLIDESVEGVWQSDRFLSLKLETLLMILERDTLAAEEHTICASLESWATSVCNRWNVEASAVHRRRALGAAYHLIRFPLLTDAQLVDGPAKTGLLLQSELCDIFRYKHGADKPQLAFCAEPRLKRIVYHTIPDVRMLQETFVYSDPVTIRKLQWKIMVYKVTDGESANLGFYLICSGYPKSTPWSCKVKAKLRLLPWKTGTAPVKKETSRLFDDKSSCSWGYSAYISMKELLNPVKGYVNPNDFSLRLQIEVA